MPSFEAKAGVPIVIEPGGSPVERLVAIGARGQAAKSSRSLGEKLPQVLIAMAARALAGEPREGDFDPALTRLRSTNAGQGLRLGQVTGDARGFLVRPVQGEAAAAMVEARDAPPSDAMAVGAIERRLAEPRLEMRIRMTGHALQRREAK